MLSGPVLSNPLPYEYRDANLTTASACACSKIPAVVALPFTSEPMRLQWGASGCQPRTASITKKPTTYATAMGHPFLTHSPTDFASGYMFDSATPAEEPNQIIEPPKPTA